MKLHLCVAFMLLSATLLGGCSRPYFTWFVNGTFERVVLVRAAPAGTDFNFANGSPWWWPARTKPVIGTYNGGYQITSYGPGQDWEFEVELGGRCTLSFTTPAPSLEALNEPQWQIYLAYEEASFQLEPNNLLYRIPAYSPGSRADVERLPQPEGFPIAPTRNNC